MKHCHRLIIGLLGLFLAGEVSGALFASKETKAYKKLRDAGRRALKAKQYDVAKTNFLAAHAALEKKGFKSYFYKGSLVDLAKFFFRRGRPDLSEPYLVTLRDYEVGRRGTNHMDAAFAYFLHGQVQKELYQFAKAEDSLRRADHIARWKVGRYSVSAGYTKAVLGQLYAWMKRDQQAIELLETGLKQMGKTRNSKEYGFGGYEIRERQHTFKPDAEDVAQVLLDYSVVLLKVGRDTDSTAAIDQAVGLLAKSRGPGTAVYRALLRLADTAEARREIPAAEGALRQALEMIQKSEGLSEKEKLRGNERLLEFYVRNGIDGKADREEKVLFNAGMPDDRILELTIRAEAMAHARTSAAE